jgi:hypothetical protein
VIGGIGSRWGGLVGWLLHDRRSAWPGGTAPGDPGALVGQKAGALVATGAGGVGHKEA